LPRKANLEIDITHVYKRVLMVHMYIYICSELVNVAKRQMSIIIQLYHSENKLHSMTRQARLVGIV